jgi:hypothetical protein
VNVCVFPVLEIVVHEPPVVVLSQRTTDPTDVPGENVNVPLLAPLHTGSIAAIAPVPIVVVGLTVIVLDSDNERVHDVVVLVINVRATTTLGVVLSVGVLNVNVPEPVPAAPVIAAPSIVPVNDQPCPVGTFDTVTEYVVELPWQIGPPTLFNVAVGRTLTFTVAVLVKAELVQPLLNTLDMVVSTDVMDTRVTSVFVVNADVVIVPEVPNIVAVLLVVPSR